MQRLEPTRALAFKVWWAFTWRQTLGIAAILILSGALIEGLGSAMGLKDKSAVGGVISLLMAPLILWMSWEVMYRVLKKRFKGFEVALVRSE